MRIAIAGGTGTLGRQVTMQARRAGHDAVVIARSRGIDVVTGEGLLAALDGVDAVIDVLNIMTLSASRAREFFVATTRSLLAAETARQVAHHVTLSVVGIDRIDAGYYAGKLAQEAAVAHGDVPHTIARSGQFYEFAGQLLSGSRGPVAVIPRALIRPVAASEVAAHLIRIVEAGPVGRATDLLGPRDEELSELARRQLAHDGVRRRVLGVRLPGRYGTGLVSGALRGTADAVHGRITFDDWLQDARRTRSVTSTG